MFTQLELDTLPMSELVAIAGADWDTGSDEPEKEYLEVCIMANTLKQIQDRLEDLDRLFAIYHNKSLLNEYNRLLREAKETSKHLYASEFDLY